MTTVLIQIAMFFVFVIPIGMGVIIFLLAAIWMSIEEDMRAKEERKNVEVQELHA